MIRVDTDIKHYTKYCFSMAEDTMSKFDSLSNALAWYLSIDPADVLKSSDYRDMIIETAVHEMDIVPLPADFTENSYLVDYPFKPYDFVNVLDMKLMDSLTAIYRIKQRDKPRVSQFIFKVRNVRSGNASFYMGRIADADKDKQHPVYTLDWLIDRIVSQQKC